MATPKDTLPQLVRLQEQDRVCDALHAAIEQIPVEIKKLSETLESEKAGVAAAKAATTKFQLAKKEKELTLGQKEEAIRKHGTELNSVKTNEAYRALQNEIDKAKNDVSDLETAILTLMEEIDKAGQEEKKAANILKEGEGKIQAQIKTLEAKKAELTAKAQEEKTKRDAISATIPADAIKLYEYLHKRMKGIAMSPIKGNMCGVCRITLMPQSLVDLARGAKLVTCEACQRILFNPAQVGEAIASQPPAEVQPTPAASNQPAQ
ncbi:MAG: hypothetical protein HY078_15565 [Elusimicrobia bacterium]|nr:hypothetical protein [Elusimicrobiota bacterium]